MSVIYGIFLYIFPFFSLALPHMRERRNLAWILWIISAIPWIPLWIGYFSKAFSPSWAVPLFGGPLTSIVLVSLFFNITYKYWKNFNENGIVRVVIVSSITILISISTLFVIFN